MAVKQEISNKGSYYGHSNEAGKTSQKIPLIIISNTTYGVFTIWCEILLSMFSNEYEMLKTDIFLFRLAKKSLLLCMLLAYGMVFIFSIF